MVYKQVVFIYRWSLEQVLLYSNEWGRDRRVMRIKLHRRDLINVSLQHILRDRLQKSIEENKQLEERLAAGDGYKSLPQGTDTKGEAIFATGILRTLESF